MTYPDEYKIAMSDMAANSMSKATVSEYGKELIAMRAERDALAAEFATTKAQRDDAHAAVKIVAQRVGIAESRVQALEAALRKIMKFSADLDPEDNARQCGHYIESVARVALEPTQSSPAATSETDSEGDTNV